MIKRIILFTNILLLITLIVSCEEIPTEVVDIQTKDYIVKEITAPSDVIYSDAGAELITTISLKNKDVIKKVWFNITGLDGATEITIALDDTKWLINSTTSGTPVQKDTEFVPYTLQ